MIDGKEVLRQAPAAFSIFQPSRRQILQNAASSGDF
jgi:hypothetical protein